MRVTTHKKDKHVEETKPAEEEDKEEYEVWEIFWPFFFSPLHDMSILGSSNLTEKEDMMS